MQQLNQISPRDEQLRKSGSSLWLYVLPGSCSSDSAPQYSLGPDPHSSPSPTPQVLLPSPPQVQLPSPPRVLLRSLPRVLLLSSPQVLLLRFCSSVLPGPAPQSSPGPAPSSFLDSHFPRSFTVFHPSHLGCTLKKILI